MKYFGELGKIEDTLYNLDKVRASLNILMQTDDMTSNQSSVPENVQTFLYDLDDRLTESMDSLKQNFHRLWDIVRSDSFQSEIEIEQQEIEDLNRWKQIVQDFEKATETQTV